MASPGGVGQQSQFQSIARQDSLYSLTLNEVQSHLGEPLHSMNLDDLLTKVFPGKVTPYLSMDTGSTATQYSSSGVVLQRQGSITMDWTLSKKTVDEVWRDIQQKKHAESRSLNHEKQPNFGEMTLEDFLTKAGVVTEGVVGRNSGVENAGVQGLAQAPHWLQQYNQVEAIHQQPEQQAPQGIMETYVPCRPVHKLLGVGSSAIYDAVFQDGLEGISASLVGTMSDPVTPGRKRGPRENIGERTVERRQKRMIKNRESAARSRARKQAYTNELENKVSRLEEENERLKKQKELYTILRSSPPPEPKYQLGRSRSAPL